MEQSSIHIFQNIAINNVNADSIKEQPWMLSAVKIKKEKTVCSVHIPETLKLVSHSQAKIQVNPEGDDVTEIRPVKQFACVAL